MIRKEKYLTYDTEDIIGKCSKCGGPIIDAIQLSNLMDLTDNERLDLELGVKTIAFCPACAWAFLTQVAMSEEPGAPEL